MAGAPCTAGVAATTAVTAPAAFTNSRRETSWSWAIIGTSSTIFPDCSMPVLVTELQTARTMQWMEGHAAAEILLGTLSVSLHAQPVPPPSTAQIKDIEVPKLTSPPRLEQFLGGASRSDMKRVDDFRQRQPGDGVPV